MTFERWIILILAVALIVGLIVGMFTYMREEISKATLMADNAARQKLIDALTQSQQQRQATADAAVKEKQAAAAKIKTPQQAAEAIPQISGLPITFRPLPNLAYEVSGPDVSALYQKLAICSEHDLMLAACQGNYGDLQKQADLLKQQRDAAVNTVRGGTFWHRFVANSKWLLIGAGAGAAGYAIARH